jgi:hypothetical protein
MTLTPKELAGIKDRDRGAGLAILDELRAPFGKSRQLVEDATDSCIMRAYDRRLLLLEVSRLNAEIMRYQNEWTPPEP